MAQQGGWPPQRLWPGQPMQNAWSPPEPVRPPSINRAVWLMLAGAALTVVHRLIIAALTDPDALMPRSSFSAARADDEQVFRVWTYAGMAFTTAVSVGLWVWLAWANGKGKAWARAVATVLGVINGAFWIIGIAMAAAWGGETGQTATARTFDLGLAGAELGVGFLALWLMYRPESNAFYEATSAQQHPLYLPYPPSSYGAYPSPGPYLPAPPTTGTPPPGSAPPPSPS